MKEALDIILQSDDDIDTFSDIDESEEDIGDYENSDGEQELIVPPTTYDFKVADPVERQNLLETDNPSDEISTPEEVSQ